MDAPVYFTRVCNERLPGQAGPLLTSDRDGDAVPPQDWQLRLAYYGGSDGVCCFYTQVHTHSLSSRLKRFLPLLMLHTATRPAVCGLATNE